MISSTQATTHRLFYIDVEVDHVPHEEGDLHHSITEIAVCDPSRPENERMFYAHVLPNKNLRLKNKELNTQVNQGPVAFKFKHVWDDLKKWVNKTLDGNRQALFVGHNIYKHDWPILSNECTRINSNIPKHWKTFDTLYLAGTLYGRGGNSQTELCHRLGVELLNAHNAKNDVIMLEGIFTKMVGAANMDKVLKAALTPPDQGPVKAVAAVIRKVAEPILVFYDFETTGLFPDKKNPDRGNPRAVELAAYIPALNKSWGTLINPGMPIPKESTAIHGITDEMVRDKPGFKAAWLSFEDFINTQLGETANKVVILAGHNVWNYDDKVYQSECERTNLPKKVWKTFDTLALGRVMGKGEKRISQKLQDWRVRLDIGENQAHRAVGDVVVNAQVWEKWVEGIPKRELDKALTSAHPARGVALLIKERGTFKFSDYTQDKPVKAPVKREREEEVEILPEESKVKKHKEEPVAVVRILDLNKNAPQPMDIEVEKVPEDDVIELVFDSTTGAMKY
jgi:DNA polymerase III epsilon subunit-like protein